MTTSNLEPTSETPPVSAERPDIEIIDDAPAPSAGPPGAGLRALRFAKAHVPFADRYDPERFEAHYVPIGILVGLLIYWLGSFLPLVVGQHQNYNTMDYDLGIFDQASWLLSHGQGFITVRGLPVLGHHLNLGLLLFAPAYWLGAGPVFLNVAMTLAIAASVVPIMAICRHYRPRQSWLGLGFCFAFLFGAVPQALLVESFHPEKMAIPFLLAALWAALGRRWRLYVVFLVLAVIWKEDLALFVLMLGIGVAWKRDRRIGLLTVLAGAGYFVLATKFVIPHFAGGDAFYSGFLGNLGSSPTELLGNAVHDPARFTDRYNTNNGTKYFLDLQRPWLFTSLLSPSSLLLALPAYLVNVLSIEGYTQNLDRHYVVVPFVASAYSAMRGTLSRARPAIRAALVVGIVLMTVWTHNDGAGPWSSQHDQGIWVQRHAAHHEVLDAAVAMVPPDASVSATHWLVPQLTRREEIYMFPNPWTAENWGINDQDARSPDRVDWLVLDLSSSPKARDLVGKIRATPCFETKLDADDVLVLHRTATGPQCAITT